MRKQAPLTTKQIELLRQRYADTDDEVLAKEFGVRPSVIKCHAIRFGLMKRSKNHPVRRSKVIREGIIPPDIEAFMRKYFALTFVRSMAEYLGVCETTVRRWAKRLGLKRSRDIVLQSLPDTLPPLTIKTRVKLLEDEILKVLREMYPEGMDDKIREVTGLHIRNIRSLARQNGIRRSEKYRKKKTCCQRVKRTAEVDEVIQREYPATSMRVLAARLDISPSYVCYIIRQLGISSPRSL